MALGEAAGVLALATCAMTMSVILLTSKLAEQHHLPFHILVGVANVLMSATLAVLVVRRGDHHKVEASCWKWVLLRGTFAAGTFTGTMLAVYSGASLGDVSALSAISVVVAAFLGRLVLGEPLGCCHLASLTCAILGALLISKPELFSGEPGTSSLTGVLFAVVAGAASGGACIAARKGQAVSPSLLCSSVALQEGLMLLLFSAIGVFKESLVATPEGWGLIAVVFVWSLFLVTLATFTMTVGAQLCPAATSSTILTAVSMTASYLFQTFVFGQPPNPVSICGALLLLLAVVLMAAARWRQAAVPVELAEGAERLSLVDFVAREFSGAVSRSTTLARSVRQRRAPRQEFSTVVPSQAIGVASA